ncbi:predicted protein [Uncinocarpus reesii 1704]|uniref:Uncharacterized protein n=1 Tax=Uncinocarpus reesii (strain UAMH 1704) TaxID=336963 RepID=C4JYD5_UNCRE|nr:uncharacterized protein UREG_07186 [Uncinocarpus reesii 1704]EEP82321.1 predicted protein [Uncinocarpus reesii 1704]
MSPIDDMYEIAYYKTGLSSHVRSNPHQSLMQSIQNDQILEYPEKMCIGNREAFQMKDRLDQALGRLDEFDEEFRTTKARFEANDEELRTTKARLEANDEELRTTTARLEELEKRDREQEDALILLRMRACEDRYAVQRNHQADRSVKQGGNRVAHGGNIVFDLKAIEYACRTGANHCQDYKTDFGAVYWIPFDRAVTSIKTFPRELIRICNTVASVEELYQYRNSKYQTDRNAAINFGAGIIQDALQAIDSGDLSPFRDGAGLAAKVQQFDVMVNNL